MTPQELYTLCTTGYGNYALRAMQGYIAYVADGDEDFDNGFFSDFFSYVNKNTLSLENPEFCTIFGDLVALAYDFMDSIDDFDWYGKYPLGIDSDDIYMLSLTNEKYPFAKTLIDLEHSLSAYESEYDDYINADYENEFGREDDDYDWDMRDFWEVI